MTVATAEAISAAIEARIAQISIANGYETDIGTKVFRGARALDPDDVPCVVIVEGLERVKDQQVTRISTGQGYALEGHTTCDPMQPNDAAHAIARDLKRAMWTGERMRGLALDGKAKEIGYRGKVIGTREPGSSLVFASIAIEVHYTEDLAAP